MQYIIQVNSKLMSLEFCCKMEVRSMSKIYMVELHFIMQLRLGSLDVYLFCLEKEPL